MTVSGRMLRVVVVDRHPRFPRQMDRTMQLVGDGVGDRFELIDPTEIYDDASQRRPRFPHRPATTLPLEREVAGAISSEWVISCMLFVGNIGDLSQDL
jgi:hypothetical protein